MSKTPTLPWIKLEINALKTEHQIAPQHLLLMPSGFPSFYLLSDYSQLEFMQLSYTRTYRTCHEDSFTFLHSRRLRKCTKPNTGAPKRIHVKSNNIRKQISILRSYLPVNVLRIVYLALVQSIIHRARWLRGNARDAHSGGPGFKSRGRPTWLRFLVVFSILK